MPSSLQPVVRQIDAKAVPQGLHRVLVIGCGLFGDALLSTHGVKSLWAALPGARFDLLAAPYSQPAYGWLGPWHRMVDPASAEGRHAVLKQARYDLAFILPGGMGWALLAWRAGIRCRIGHLSDHRGFFLTGKIALDPGRPNYENFTNLVGALPFPVPVTPAKPRCDLVPIPPPFVVFAPGASEAAKQWPQAHWRELAHRVRRQGTRTIVWLGSVKEKDLIQSLAAPGDVEAAGRFPFDELCGLLGHAERFVGNNSGLSHLAGLCDAPTLVLTGPSNPVLTRPFGDRVELLWVDDPKIPVLKRGDRRYRHALPMDRITVDRVWSRLEPGVGKVFTASAGTETPGPGN